MPSPSSLPFPPPLRCPRINAYTQVNGGSIAIGHPFAATGGRVVTAAMNELRRSKKKNSLVSICAAGGIGAVGIVERDASKA